MVRHYADDAVPTEVGFRRQQILAEVLRDEAAYHIAQGCQDQNPCKKEMKRSVPNRGANDKRYGKINERRGPDSAGFAPVEARGRYENGGAADTQAKYAQHDEA